MADAGAAACFLGEINSSQRLPGARPSGLGGGVVVPGGAGCGSLTTSSCASTWTNWNCVPRQWGACWLASVLPEVLERLATTARSDHVSRPWSADPGSDGVCTGNGLMSAMALLDPSTDDTLHRCLDQLIEHKAALFSHLQERWICLPHGLIRAARQAPVCTSRPTSTVCEVVSRWCHAGGVSAGIECAGTRWDRPGAEKQMARPTGCGSRTVAFPPRTLEQMRQSEPPIFGGLPRAFEPTGSLVHPLALEAGGRMGRPNQEFTCCGAPHG